MFLGSSTPSALCAHERRRHFHWIRSARFWTCFVAFWLPITFAAAWESIVSRGWVASPVTDPFRSGVDISRRKIHCLVGRSRRSHEQIASLGGGNFRRVQKGSVQRLRNATIWGQHLWSYRPGFVKPVTPAQKAKTVVASGAAVLPFTHKRWRAVSCHGPVVGSPRFSVLALARMILVDSFRRVRCIGCSAAAASDGSWSCAGKRVCRCTYVVVRRYVWDRGRCAFPLELADGGFARLFVIGMLFVSAGVITLVDFYFILLGCS